MKTLQLVLIASLFALSLAAIVKRETIQEIHYPNLDGKNDKTTTEPPTTLAPQLEKGYLAQIIDFIFGLFGANKSGEAELGNIDSELAKHHPIILGPPVNGKIEKPLSVEVEKIEKKE